MRFEFTLRGVGDDQDVAVVSGAPVAFAALRAELSRLAGAPADAAWSSAGRVIDADTRLGSAQLRTGSVISLGVATGTTARPVEQAGYAVRVVGGPSAGRSTPLGRRVVSIGRAPGCDVVLADDRVSRRHASIDASGSLLRIRDHGSTNGSSVDGRPVGDVGRDIRPGEVIRLGDSLLVVSAPDVTPLTLAADSDTTAVSRPARSAPSLPQPEIELPAPVEGQRPRPVQWLAVLLPAAAAGAISWFAHSPVFLLFAALTPVMMLSGAAGDRLHWRRSRRRASSDYRRCRAEAGRRVAAAVHAETVARRAEFPDPVTLGLLATTPAVGLWSRARHDAMRVRIGTADRPATVRARSGPHTAPAGTVRDVPVTLDLDAGPVGLVGPADVVAGLARWLVAQLAVAHSPADLTIALLLSPDAAPRWHWVRWLPHLGGGVAISPADHVELVGDLKRTVDGLTAQSRLSARPDAGPLRRTVLVIDGAGQLGAVPGLAALLRDGQAGGLTAVCVDTDGRALPAACTTTVVIDGPGGARVVVRPGESRALVDRVDAAWVDQVGRSLAPLADPAGTDGACVPVTCRLLDLLDAADLDVEAVRARWSVSDGRPHTLLGMSAQGPVRLDLAADGPHLLVAGTTGAGKSELLQSLVTGLAVLHPPDELTFLLVDYKGGAAFAGCSGLPHSTGLVTDLDPQLTRRALQSLDAELRRRELLFASVGTADLAAYRMSAPAEQVARLVIVVDEFATLADELPDFVRGLVSIAQRGRSLGIHLVLATQRPGRAVSPEIRANISARIALRVTDPGESSDVLDVPDAASIDRRTPGRGYLRTGATLVCFQTARTGGTPAGQRAGPLVQRLGAWRRPLLDHAGGSDPDNDADELARVVAALAGAAARRPTPRRPWLPALPSVLEPPDLPPDDTPGAGAVPIGLVDLPGRQAQLPLLVDLSRPVSTLVIGAPGSGRSSGLAALALGSARRSGPDVLEMYVVDSGVVLTRQLGGLAHVVTGLGPGDVDLVATLLQRLQASLARREAAARPDTPAVLLLVDGWDRLLAGHDDASAVRCVELLTALLSTGPAARLTTVVSGDRTMLTPRFAGCFGERLVLRLSDPQDYLLAGIPVASVPRDMPPGRGLRASDGAQFQLVRPAQVPEPGRASAEHGRLDPDAVVLRPLPARVTLRELPAGERLRLGLAGDDASPIAVDVFAGSGRWLVAGPPRSGRSTVLATLLSEGGRVGLSLVVAAPRRSPLDALARAAGIRVISPGDEAVGALPAGRSVLLVDDSDAFTETVAGETMSAWVRQCGELAVVLSGRCDDLGTTFRGLAAEVRRSRCGLLLRPGPVDGELFGLRLARSRGDGPPGRGLLIGEPGWGPLFRAGDPVPVQIATTE